MECIAAVARACAPLSKSDANIVNAAMARMGVDAMSERDVASLSGGQRQRAWIAMTLAQEAPIMLMDEPTTYLDISHQVEVLNLARELADEGKAVVVVLHDLNQAFRSADRVAVLSNGRLVSVGRPREIATSDLLKSVFEIGATIESDPHTASPMMAVVAPTDLASHKR